MKQRSNLTADTDFSNQVNYITYCFGDPGDIKKSIGIRLFYNKYETPNVSTIVDIHNKTIKESSFNESGFNTIIYKEFDKPYFEINFDNSKTQKFNTVIYYSGDSSLPSGFTVFSRIQNSKIDENSNINTIRLYPEFKVNLAEEDEETDVLIINTLSSLKVYSNEDSSLARRLLSDKEDLSNYASINDVKKYFNDTKNASYIRYTSSLSSLINDSTLMLTTDCLNILNSKDGLNYYKFFVSNGIAVNTYDVKYTKFFVSLYNSDIALFEYSEEQETLGTYRIISLTKKNTFNLPTVLVQKGIVPNVTKNMEVISMSGNYIVFRDNFTEDWSVFNMKKPEEGLISVSSNFGVLFDPWSLDEDITYFSKESTISSPFEAFPITSNFYKQLIALPIDPEIKDSIVFLKKIGPWYVFKTTNNTNKVTLVYVSLYGSIYFDESEENEIIPINSKCILHQKKSSDENKGYEFVFYFINNKAIPVRSDLQAKKNGYGSENDYKIKFNSSYDEKDIERVILIDGLRRAPITTYSFPKDRTFITSFYGILFYLEEDSSGEKKIYYL